MKISQSAFIVSIFSLLMFSCAERTEEKNLSSERPQQEAYQAPEDALFRLLSPEESGIHFENTLVENDRLNYLNYTYLYNGSGVAVLDFDQDGLMDIFFVGANTYNRLYRNLGDMKFKDVTLQAGVQGEERLKTGVAVHDVNMDGYPDLYVCHSGLQAPKELTNALYINQGDGTFKNEAVQRGLDDQTNTDHALFFDMDNDNDLDLFLLNHPVSFNMINNLQLRQNPDGSISREGIPDNEQEGDKLYRNDGEGNFTDVTKEAGVWGRAYGLSVTPMDINEDGWMDLYVGNDFVEPDFLYINQKDGTFENQLDLYFPHTSNNTMGADAGDLNNDGAVDFISLDMLPEDHYRQKTLMTVMRYNRYKQLEQYDYGNQLMRNMLFVKGEDGKMRDIGNLAGIDATDWSWSPLIHDFDQDGWKDIFITNGYRRDLTDADYLTYYDELVSKGKRPEAYRDTLLSLVPSVPIPNYMYRNKGNLTFENKAAEWGLAQPGFSNGAAHADLDNDGDEDLIINNFDMQVALYENRVQQLRQPNVLSVRLKGPAGNPDGIGARIAIQNGAKNQTQWVQRIKGFMSFSSPRISFGLGSEQQVEVLEVFWPDRRYSRLENLSANEPVVIDYKESVSQRPTSSASAPQYFGEEEPLITYRHFENEFIDVKREPLIPRCFSREGPVVEVGDLNQDGRSDIIIGGAVNQPLEIHLQQADGRFQKLEESLFAKEAPYEDVALALIDVDQNGFLDIYVGSGGNAFPLGSEGYHDRLYLNQDGRSFTKAKIPTIHSSTGTVSTADIDMDGDLDIFVGGYIVPNAYPQAPYSYVLINDGGTLVDRTETWHQDLKRIGMVSSSSLVDMNGDDKPDLVLAGEWMPLQYFPNEGDQFGFPVRIPDSEGWWVSHQTADVDGDGDLDIIAGNIGMNTKWQASPNEPIEVYAKDFDQNGKFDAILTQYVMGDKSVAARRSTLTSQMTSIRPKFVKHSTYANAEIEDIVDIESPGVLHLSAKELRSGWFEQKSPKEFVFHPFPAEAQMAPLYAMQLMDLDGNGQKDILAGGNDFHLEIETARADGNALMALLQKEAGWQWQPLDGRLNVFNKALRDIDLISIGKEKYVILSFNDEGMRFFPLKVSPQALNQ